MLRLVMLSFSACFFLAKTLDLGFTRSRIDCVVINLLSFHKAPCFGFISLHVEYQNTNVFVLARELGFTVNRCTLVTVLLVS